MRRIIAKVAVGLFTAALTGNVVVGQQTNELTVQASRTVEKQVGRDSHGLAIVDVSLSYGVSYAGLDLASHADVMELRRRVDGAAQKACKELIRQYPIPTETEAQCIKAATERAMLKANELVSAASKAAAK
jgi:UrcA family protein